jgi:hypothetical protein
MTKRSSIEISMRFAALLATLCVVESAHASPPEPVMSSTQVHASEPSADIVLPPLEQTPEKATGTLPVPAVRGHLRLSRSELCDTAAAVATANKLPTVFFANLIHQESGFQTHVVSRAGAQGIAQFMPKVAASYGLADPFEPIAALTASGKLLAELVAEFGNLGLAAAAYNAGPKRVQDWMAKRRRLPVETVHYVHSITGRSAEQWANQGGTEIELELPQHARCANNSAGPTKAIDPRTAPTAPVTSSGNQRASVSNSERTPLVRRSMPQPSEFAIGLPVSRFAIRAQRFNRPRLAPRHAPIMDRFVATATPTIMAEQEMPKRRSIAR